MIAGFTGTRKGMSEGQMAFLASELQRLKIKELHHGCCVGGDDEANTLARGLHIRTEGHPPTNKKLIAECVVDFMHPAEPYIERNHIIVDTCEVLFVGPRTNVEIIQSGTWATFRYAHYIERRIIMLER